MRLVRPHLFVLLLAAWAALGVHAQAAPPAPRFTLTDLGPLPRVADDIAPSLAPDGSVAAWASGAGGRFHAVLWPKPSGGGRDLGALPAAADSYAAAVGPGGLVVGVAKDPADLRFSQAFAWRAGRMRALPTLGGRYATARAVSAAGLVAGGADLPDGQRHACLWSGGTARDLGTLPGGDFSLAHGINAAGVAVGASDISPNGKSHAFLWRAGRMQELGLLPGGSLSVARAVSDRDEVVGWADIHGGDTHPFLWRGGVMTDLGALGDDPCAAWGINNHGQVVGAGAVGPGKLHAFFWQERRMSDLNDLIPAGTGWVLETACAINDRGWIIGLGRLRGVSRLFLLRPVLRVK